MLEDGEGETIIFSLILSAFPDQEGLVGFSYLSIIHSFVCELVVGVGRVFSGKNPNSLGINQLAVYPCIWFSSVS